MLDSSVDIVEAKNDENWLEAMGPREPTLWDEGTFVEIGCVIAVDVPSAGIELGLATDEPLLWTTDDPDNSVEALWLSEIVELPVETRLELDSMYVLF